MFDIQEEYNSKIEDFPEKWTYFFAKKSDFLNDLIKIFLFDKFEEFFNKELQSR